ncbi:MAG: NFACT family protein [Clostridia bacterium]|nr:NFACT family protein [Clostridia bacterium]
MPLDGLTLSFVARELQFLLGGRIDRVTQPEKDMIVLLIRAEGKNCRLLISASPSMTRFHLTEQTYQNPPDAPMFCMLLRKYLLGGRIQNLEQLYGDRLIRLVIDNRDELGESGPRELWFEAMGRHSNLTLVKDGRIIDALRHVSPDMSRVRTLLPGLPFEAPPRQDKLAPNEVTNEALWARLHGQTGPLKKALAASVSGLSAVSAAELTLRLTGLSEPRIEEIDLPVFCQKAEELFARLTALSPAVVLTDDSGARVDFFPFRYFSFPQEAQIPCASLSDAMDRFYTGRDRLDRMQQKTASLRKNLRNHIERNEKKLLLQEDALRDAADAERYRLRGELLSAQLYKVPKGANQVVLDNYYDEQGISVTVALDESLSPAQNAQRYFKRYRKAIAARKTAAEQKEKTLAELRLLEEALLDLEHCETQEDLAEVRHTLEEAGILKREKGRARVKRPAEGKPLSFQTADGFTALVGKNSAQNERLTKSAAGDDVWLHAKDMPGSHVIVRTEGRPLTDAALLDAARLAAFYSKARGVSVPVDYTLRKYVKKPAGTPLGFVTFVNNRTLLIDATEADVRRLQESV